MRRAVYEFPAHITVEEATRAYMEAAGGVQTVPVPRAHERGRGGMGVYARSR